MRIAALLAILLLAAMTTFATPAVAPVTTTTAAKGKAFSLPQKNIAAPAKEASAMVKSAVAPTGTHQVRMKVCTTVYGGQKKIQNKALKPVSLLPDAPQTIPSLQEKPDHTQAARLTATRLCNLAERHLTGKRPVMVYSV